MTHTADLDLYLAFLTNAGVSLERMPELVRDPDQPGRPHADGAAVRELRLEGLPAIREHRDPGRSVSACHATISVARAMVHNAVVRPGEPFWDVGCGTGVLVIAAALLGARPVLATDVDPDALALARRNVEEAGVSIDVAQCSLLERAGWPPVGALVVANLPHKPVRSPGQLPLSNDGGPDGDTLFRVMLDQFAERRSDARLLFFLHSLPHPRLLARIGRERRLTLLSWKRRFIEPGEFGPLQEWFVERHAAGTSYVGETADGRRYLVCGVWLAEPR